MVAERGMPLTVCPQSNVRLTSIVPSLEEHPWPAMAAAGLHLTLNSDDPAFMGTDLGEEYAALARALGTTSTRWSRSRSNGVDATWLPEADKDRCAGGCSPRRPSSGRGSRTPRRRAEPAGARRLGQPRQRDREVAGQAQAPAGVTRTSVSVERQAAHRPGAARCPRRRAVPRPRRTRSPRVADVEAALELETGADADRDQVRAGQRHVRRPHARSGPRSRA